MAPRGTQIPDAQRCQHWFDPLRRCGRYAAVLDGTIVSGYCWQHQKGTPAPGKQG